MIHFKSSKIIYKYICKKKTAFFLLSESPFPFSSHSPPTPVFTFHHSFVDVSSPLVINPKMMLATSCITGDRYQSNRGDPVSSVVHNGDSLTGSLKARFQLLIQMPESRHLKKTATTLTCPNIGSQTCALYHFFMLKKVHCFKND